MKKIALMFFSILFCQKASPVALNHSFLNMQSFNFSKKALQFYKNFYKTVEGKTPSLQLPSIYNGRIKDKILQGNNLKDDEFDENLKKFIDTQGLNIKQSKEQYKELSHNFYQHKNKLLKQIIKDTLNNSELIEKKRRENIQHRIKLNASRYMPLEIKNETFYKKLKNKLSHTLDPHPPKVIYLPEKL